MKSREGFVGPVTVKENMVDVGVPPLSSTTVDVIGSELKRLLLEGNDKSNVDLEQNENRITKFCYPQRPNEPDCSYYLKTGSCRYGSNCRFNHPFQRNSKENGGFKENEESQQEQQEDFPERVGQPECKYYMKTGSCKFGKACRFHHPREKNSASLTLNFMGLPFRPGEKECPYYMRTGFCKFAVYCRFHHPDPTAAVESDIDHGYNDDGSVPVPLHGPSVSPQPNTTWPWKSTSNETAPFYDLSLPYMPAMPPQATRVYQNPDWNGLQGSVRPVYPSLQGAQPSVSNDPNMASNNCLNQRQISIEEFPERPGQPECQFFMRNGDCKFRSACKYHHPKNQTIKSPGCVLSPLGLPLRPDQTVCMHYSRFGICKFGPSCKFDHPMDHGSSSATSPVMVHLNGNLSMGETRMAA